MSDFRPVYRQLNTSEQQHIRNVKNAAADLFEYLCFPGCHSVDEVRQREFALARTKLEECVMWATKAISS